MPLKLPSKKAPTLKPGPAESKVSLASRPDDTRIDDVDDVDDVWGDDDVDVHASSEAEQIAASEVNDILSAFRERARKEAKRVSDVTTSEYWLCFCFDSQEAKHEFMQKWGLAFEESKYVNGGRFSGRHGKPLTTEPLPVYRQRFRGNVHNLAKSVRPRSSDGRLLTDQ